MRSPNRMLSIGDGGDAGERDEKVEILIGDAVCSVTLSTYSTPRTRPSDAMSGAHQMLPHAAMSPALPLPEPSASETIATFCSMTVFTSAGLMSRVAWTRRACARCGARAPRRRRRSTA